jgi:hypothetical protein
MEDGRSTLKPYLASGEVPNWRDYLVISAPQLF